MLEPRAQRPFARLPAYRGAPACRRIYRGRSGVPMLSIAHACMKRTRDMLIRVQKNEGYTGSVSTRAVSIGPFCRVYRVEPCVICTIVVFSTVYSSTGYRNSVTPQHGVRLAVSLTSR